MSLDKTEIANIARLARLGLEDAALPDYGKDLEKILGLVEQMDSVNTDDIAPLAHPMEIKARLRSDVVTETDQRQKYQQIAPAVKDGHYLVPKVIE